MNSHEDCQRARPRDLYQVIRGDAERYLYYSKRPYGLGAVLVLLLSQPGFLATVLYRFAHWVHSDPKRNRGSLRLVYECARRPVEIITGMTIAPSSHIGPGLYIAHFGGVVVGENCTIGANCNLGHDTLIAPSGRGDRAGSPVIGDRVNITCGARVLGPISIGDDAMIGVNAVVVKDVDPRAVVAPAPSMTLSHRGSFSYLRYTGDENDAARNESLAQCSDT